MTLLEFKPRCRQQWSRTYGVTSAVSLRCEREWVAYAEPKAVVGRGVIWSRVVKM